MASVRITPWKTKKDSAGTVPLYLVIRHRNKRATIALPVRIKESDWNEKRSEIRKSHEDHVRLNLRLTETLQKARAALQDALFENGSVSAHQIKVALLRDTEPDATDFFSYYESRLDEYRRRKQWATSEAYGVALSKLRDYTRRTTGRTTLEFDQLTVSFLEGFRTYLIERCNNHKNTVHKNLATIRTILYSAIREGRFPQEKNPFFQLRLEKEKRTKNKAIEIEDIWKIEDANLGEGRINDVRNCFLFAFYNAGMRVSDILQLQGQDIVRREGKWRVEYEMEKTGAQSFSMPLLPISEKILTHYGWPEVSHDQYIFPFLPQNLRRGARDTFHVVKTKTVLMNKYLKSIQAKCGINTHLTTHVARHALSRHLDRNGFNLGKIQEVLRHGDRSTTEVYVHKMRAGRFDKELEQALMRTTSSPRE